jgi:hypothetical protein
LLQFPDGDGPQVLLKSKATENILTTHLASLEKIEGMTREAFVMKQMEQFQKLNQPQEGETEAEKNKRESTSGLFHPERFIKNKLYHETSLDVLTNA